jgi:hypothetical protein
VRRTPKGGVLTEKDSRAAPASTRVRGCTQSHGQSCGACLERFFEPLTGAAAPAWELLRRQTCPKWTCCTNAAACVQACESESAHAPTCMGRKLTRVARERARPLRSARTHPAPRGPTARAPFGRPPRAGGAHRAPRCAPPTGVGALRQEPGSARRRASGHAAAQRAQRARRARGQLRRLERQRRDRRPLGAPHREGDGRRLSCAGPGGRLDRGQRAAGSPMLALRD